MRINDDDRRDVGGSLSAISEDKSFRNDDESGDTVDGDTANEEYLNRHFEKKKHSAVNFLGEVAAKDSNAKISSNGWHRSPAYGHKKKGFMNNRSPTYGRKKKGIMDIRNSNVWPISPKDRNTKKGIITNRVLNNLRPPVSPKNPKKQEGSVRFNLDDGEHYHSRSPNPYQDPKKSVSKSRVTFNINDVSSDLFSATSTMQDEGSETMRPINIELLAFKLFKLEDQVSRLIKEMEGKTPSVSFTSRHSATKPSSLLELDTASIASSTFHEDESTEFLKFDSISLRPKTDSIIKPHTSYRFSDYSVLDRQDPQSLAFELSEVQTYVGSMRESMADKSMHLSNIIAAATPNSSKPRRNPDAESGAGFYNGSDPKSKRRFSMAYRTDDTIVTYPDDCFSFLTIHGPIGSPFFFWFGMSVTMLQVSFLILMILSVVHPRFNGGTDNPYSNFVPTNVDILVRVAQCLAVISYCVFAETSLKDIITAIELWPSRKKVKKGDKYWNIVFSCVLRFILGLLTVISTFLMFVASDSVADTILDFLAMNFISDIGKMAFQLALWGKYGPTLEAEALRIEDQAMPQCMLRPHSEKRYKCTIWPIVIFVLAMMATIMGIQISGRFLTTKTIRVQFVDNADLELYNGCYYATDHKYTEFYSRMRKMFQARGRPDSSAKFGYCVKTQKWFFFDSEHDNPCDVADGEEVAFSSTTTAFDISSTFSNGWFINHGTSIDVQFFSEPELDGTCDSFMNDGRCDSIFNSRDNDYDGGDCCASTCTKSNCGVGALTSAFDNEINGDGFPNCLDPAMVPITISIDSIFHYSIYEQHADVGRYDNENDEDDRTSSSTDLTLPLPATPISDSFIIEPIMLLDCDDRNVLTVNINVNMASKMETVMVEDGTKCTIRINNSTIIDSPIWYVNYTVYHGDRKSVEEDPIVILQEQSMYNEFANFERIPNCYIERLSDHLDSAAIYTGTGPQNQAIEWLRMTSRVSQNSLCEDDYFVDRYALSVLNFAAPVVLPISPPDGSSTETIDNDFGPLMDLSTGNSSLNVASTPRQHEVRGISYEELWIKTQRNCFWQNVKCDELSIVSLDLRRYDLYGTIASSISLLTNLTNLQFADNYLKGTIPSEVGQLTLLKTLSFANNALNGTIPIEIGEMKNLEVLNLSNNALTGSIPTNFGIIARDHSLTRVDVSGNGALVLDGMPIGLKDIVHTNCVICKGGRSRKLDDREYNSFSCEDLAEKFERNNGTMTVNECETLERYCSTC